MNIYSLCIWYNNLQGGNAKKDLCSNTFQVEVCYTYKIKCTVKKRVVRRTILLHSFIVFKPELLKGGEEVKMVSKLF
jgi:hypothetical protein